MKNKKILWGILVIAILIGAGGYWYTQIKIPYDNAVKTFNAVAKNVQEKNNNLDKEIDKAQSILDSGEQPLDETTFTNLQVSISTAKETKRKIPTVAKKTDDVKKETTELQKELDYSKVISDLDLATKEAETSIEQLKQVTNPSEDFIVTKLSEIDLIKDIGAVTEENDPNGQLNKAGGYTAAVYFSSTLVDQNKVFGTDVIDKGTSAGGCVEVYKTVEEATKRNDYLTGFDGGILSAGGHTVVGTVIIRTSDEMTATNQKELENEIINKLTTIN